MPRPRTPDPRRAVTLTTCVLLAACAGTPQHPPSPPVLPEHARPHWEPMRPESYTATDVTGYRPLTRSDFRAARPPARFASEGEHMGAYTCTNIVPEADPSVRITPHADGRVTARLASLRVRAEMDRSCSWWNEHARLDPAYVLEHEQIHFALTEIEARRLRSRMLAVEVVERTPEAATAELQRAFDRITRETSEALVRRNTRFDEETSLRFAPDVQGRWRRAVERELAELAP